METFKYIRYAFLSCLVMSAFLFTLSSCEEEDGVPLEEPNGKPEIRYVRVTNPDAADSLLVKANLGQGIVLVGKNLGGTREVWFNDRQATVSPSWVTNRTVLVSVPNIAPLNITNEIYLVDKDADTLAYDFEVTIPDPEVLSAKNEWPTEGENLIINGNYFFDVEGEVPVVVTFTGDVESEAEVVNSSQISVPIPDGAEEGPVTVTTNFGSTTSSFHLWDSRNIILDFDNVRGNGWRIGLVESGDGGVDGAYNVFRAEELGAGRDEGPGAPSESPLLFEYWGGVDGRTENFYEEYPNSYKDYVMKFEAKVDTWGGGHLNICLSSPEHNGNNQEIWSNNYNARALWAPWEEEGEVFTTDGEWITVTVPMTDFQYYADQPGDYVEYTGGQSFVEENAGSLSMWLIGSPENAENPEVEFYIDNIRFVQP